VSAFVDTSVLVRYLTADPPEMLDVARRIVDETDPLVLTDVVLTESAFVLLSFYRVPRRAIVDGLVDLLHKENVAVHGLDKDLAIRALLFCRDSGRVSFADAMVWAAACSAAGATRSPATVYAFDQRFPSEGLDVRGG
jgi:predicted nucleic acid-binding protein